jgi:hypothetical protein
MSRAASQLSRYPQAMGDDARLMTWWCRETEDDMATAVVRDATRWERLRLWFRRLRR